MQDTSHRAHGYICLSLKSNFLINYDFYPLLNGELRTLHESLTCYQVLGSVSDTLFFPFAN